MSAKPESHLAIVAREKRAAKTAPVEVIPAPEAVLSVASKALKKHRDILIKQEETFFSATLGSRLQIGLHCLKAHQVFCIPEHGKRNKAGRNQHSKGQVTRDEASPQGFEGWLSTEAQWLKKPVAYKYMTAVRGLGLDHTSTEKQVAAALKAALRKGPVTLASLVAAAVERIAPPADPPPNLQQSEFDFIRGHLSSMREEIESVVHIKDRLRLIPDAHKAACARLYAALYELTGTWWAPSNDPDDLASVNPDAITI